MLQQIEKCSEDSLLSCLPTNFSKFTKCGGKLKLIKVPKFVSNAWERAEDKSIVGFLKRPAPHEAGELLISNSCMTDGISVLNGVKRNKSNLYIMQPKAENTRHANICGRIDDFITFVPKLNNDYLSLLKRRHQNSIKYKGRSTTEEDRDNFYNANDTLFQYYNPRDCGNGINGNSFTSDISRRMSFDMANQRQSKQKQKKTVTMTEDMLRMKIFQLFEKVGEEGLTLKRAGMEVDQPLSFVKSVLEEVGEQRKRSSDRRSVYFLKDHYNAVYSLASSDCLHSMSKPTFN